MADIALQVDFILAGYRDPTSDEELAGGKIYTYLDGTSTLSSLWTDKDKGGVSTNPVVLDSSGKAEIYGDNIYKMEIFDSNDILIETLNGLQYKASISASKSLKSDYGCDLSAALAAIGTVEQTTLTIDCACIIAGGTSETITDNISIDVIKGGSFDGVAGGGTETLNIEGPLISGIYQIFGDNLSTSISDSSIDRVHPAWWNVDGSADDIQINKALSVSGGKTLVLEAYKIYSLDATVIIAADYVTIEGNGATFKVSTTGGGHGVLIIEREFIYSTIDHLIFDGNDAVRTGLVSNLASNNVGTNNHAYGAVIKNCTFLNSSSWGINMQNGYQWTIKNCDFSVGEGGVRMHAARGSKVIKCTFANDIIGAGGQIAIDGIGSVVEDCIFEIPADMEGIFITVDGSNPVSDNKIINNTFRGDVASSFGITDASGVTENLLISGNSFSSLNRGVSSSAIFDSVIKGNTFDDMGFGLLGSFFGSSIIGNIFKNSLYGCRFNNIRDSSVTGNVFRKLTVRAILGDASNGCVYSGNSFSDICIGSTTSLYAIYNTVKNFNQIVQGNSFNVSLNSIEGISRDVLAVVTWEDHKFVAGKSVEFSDITDANWTSLNGENYSIASIIDEDSFSINLDTSAFASDYLTSDPGLINLYQSVQWAVFNIGTYDHCVYGINQISKSFSGFSYNADQAGNTIQQTPVLRKTQSWDPASIASLGNLLSPTFAVNDAQTRDTVVVYPPYSLQGVQATGYVSATGFVIISLFNGTAGAIDLGTGNWIVEVTKSNSTVY
jgi:hypothetical protein